VEEVRHISVCVSHLLNTTCSSFTAKIGFNQPQSGSTACHILMATYVGLCSVVEQEIDVIIAPERIRVFITAPIK
jgi:hypothetical protein